MEIPGQFSVKINKLPPTDEIVMVAGTPPIRAKKARYYEDKRLNERILPPPEPAPPLQRKPDDWSDLPLPTGSGVRQQTSEMLGEDEDPTGSERRHQPELSRVEPVDEKKPVENEFEIDLTDDTEDDTARTSRMTRVMQGVARQVSLDPGDGMEL